MVGEEKEIDTVMNVTFRVRPDRKVVSVGLSEFYRLRETLSEQHDGLFFLDDDGELWLTDLGCEHFEIELGQ